MTQYQYDVDIHLAGAGDGDIEGSMAMSFGSVKGSSSQKLKLRFHTYEDVLEMMVDEKPYIRFTNYDYTEQDYFIYKSNILYVSQRKTERL